MTRLLLWLPLAGFALLLAVVASGIIKPNDHVVRSHMIDKPSPAFALQPILPDKPGLASADLRDGKPHLVNIFASWCIPCAAESPELMKLTKLGVTIDAIAIRDKPADVRAFLSRYGDPYARIGDDQRASVQMAFGSSGVPESFVVDGKGRIRLQHVGAIRADDVPGIMAALQAAE